jgi:hypothetical protein
MERTTVSRKNQDISPDFEGFQLATHQPQVPPGDDHAAADGWQWRGRRVTVHRRWAASRLSACRLLQAASVLIALAGGGRNFFIAVALVPLDASSDAAFRTSCTAEPSISCQMTSLLFITGGLANPFCSARSACR